MAQHDDSRRSRKVFSASVLPFTIRPRHLSWRPTRFGLVFALLVTGILAGAVNYANNLGFLLGFLLGGVGVVSLFHGYGNLTALTLAAIRAEPVFAGEGAVFELFTRADGSGAAAVRFALEKQPASTTPTDLSSGGTTTIRIRVPAPRRGLLDPGGVMIISEYPLGLFRFSCRLQPDLMCLVYPRPAAEEIMPVRHSAGRKGEGKNRGAEDDDFQGLRPYRPGDPLQHISWKASARGQGFFTKEFAGTGGATAWLDWDAVAEQDLERKLALLCYAVLQAHRERLEYGLRLSGRVIEPDSGERHQKNCLEALALYSSNET
jgi:uncharacterized protein (DUF58 family)